MAKKKTMVLTKDVKKRVLRDLFVAISQGEIVSEGCASVSRRYAKLGYDISPNTLRNYWARRNEWIIDVFDLTDAEVAGRELLAESIIIKQEQWKLFNATKNDSVRLGVLRDIAKHNFELLSMFQDLGLVPTSINDGDLLTMNQVDRFVRIIDSAFHDEPEIKSRIAQALIEREGYKRVNGRWRSSGQAGN